MDIRTIYNDKLETKDGTTINLAAKLRRDKRVGLLVNNPVPNFFFATQSWLILLGAEQPISPLSLHFLCSDTLLVEHMIVEIHTLTVEDQPPRKRNPNWEESRLEWCWIGTYSHKNGLLIEEAIPQLQYWDAWKTPSHQIHLRRHTKLHIHPRILPLKTKGGFSDNQVKNTVRYQCLRANKNRNQKPDPKRAQLQEGFKHQRKPWDNRTQRLEHKNQRDNTKTHTTPRAVWTEDLHAPLGDTVWHIPLIAPSEPKTYHSASQRTYI